MSRFAEVLMRHAQVTLDKDARNAAATNSFN
jgi:hypothetical protein